MGTLTIILVSSLANAGGIGGGALLTPVYIWLFDFSVEDAIPLSKMTIFTGAIVNYIVLKNQRLDGDNNKPLINYSMAGVIVPMLLAGTAIGVFGAKVFPPILILLFLSGFLILSTCNMFSKAVQAWKKETRDKNQDANQEKILYDVDEEKVPFQKNQSQNSRIIDQEQKINFLDEDKFSTLKKGERSEENLSKEIVNNEISLKFKDFINQKNPIIKVESNVDSESKSLCANPFWKETDSNSKMSNISKIDKNQISKFKTNTSSQFLQTHENYKTFQLISKSEI